jgi:hypothetical protein
VVIWMMWKPSSAGAERGVGTRFTQPIVNNQIAESDKYGVLERAAMGGIYNFDCFFGKGSSPNARKWFDAMFGSHRGATIQRELKWSHLTHRNVNSAHRYVVLGIVRIYGVGVWAAMCKR